MDLTRFGELLPGKVDYPCYILFNDDSFMMFTDESFQKLFNKMIVTIPYIKSIGKVETNKWVCWNFDGERDIDATMIMRQKFGV